MEWAVPLFGVIVDVSDEIEGREEIERARTERLAAVARYKRAVDLASDVMFHLRSGRPSDFCKNKRCSVRSFGDQGSTVRGLATRRMPSS